MDRFKVSSWDKGVYPATNLMPYSITVYDGVRLPVFMSTDLRVGDAVEQAFKWTWMKQHGKI
jgi:hypothetical protein